MRALESDAHRSGYRVLDHTACSKLDKIEIPHVGCCKMGEGGVCPFQGRQEGYLGKIERAEGED